MEVPEVWAGTQTWTEEGGNTFERKEILGLGGTGQERWAPREGP